MLFEHNLFIAVKSSAAVVCKTRPDSHLTNLTCFITHLFFTIFDVAGEPFIWNACQCTDKHSIHAVMLNHLPDRP